MTETLAASVPTVASPAPAAGTAPTATPGTAADAFMAVLFASALATGPPPGTPAPTARTASAEGKPAGGDSSGTDTPTPDAGDPSQAQGLMGLLALGTMPVQQGPTIAAPAKQPAPQQSSSSVGAISAPTETFSLRSFVIATAACQKSRFPAPGLMV